MENLILYSLGEIKDIDGDIVKRFASTLSRVINNTADYIIKKDILYNWGRGDKGFDFYPVKEEKELIILKR